MRLRMRRQLAAQLACTAQDRAFLSEELDLLDLQVGVEAFVNKYPPTINAGECRVVRLTDRVTCGGITRACSRVDGLSEDALEREPECRVFYCELRQAARLHAPQ
jgi:hypothetical protein